MNLTAFAIKSGKVWRDNTAQIVDQAVDAGCQQAQQAAINAIKPRVPVKTGQLQRSIIARGRQLQRSVRMDLGRGIPLDSGWTPAHTQAKIRTARNTYKLKGKRKLIRSLKASRVAGRHFFLKTFEAIQPFLHATYLAPVGVGIIKALEA